MEKGEIYLFFFSASVISYIGGLDKQFLSLFGSYPTKISQIHRGA